ncbi:MAG: DUF4340 domain-containing protein [Steroidobacteraceae bacterium]|nr:DUF4340 domain-containing protein [Steroidobacteraceae bacterium]
MPRKLLILSIAALVAITAGVWLASRGSSGGADGQRVLYPQLKGQLDSIESVRIYKAGDQRAVELRREDSRWKVVERAGYPADEAKLGRLVRAIADAKLFEEKTANPENYPALGVEEVSDAAASGVRVEIAGVQPPIDLIVGKAGPAGQSRYVRRVQEAQSWLVDADIDASASPAAWLRKDIVDVSADRMQSATVSLTGKKPYTAAKDSRTAVNFVIANLPKGKKLTYESAPNTFATALASLTLNDVEPAGEFEGKKPQAQATYTTFDGLVVQLDGWSNNEQRYIAVKTSFDPQIAERFALPTAAADDADDAEGADTNGEDASNAAKAAADQQDGAADGDARADHAGESNAAEEAAKANERLAGWVFEIPSYKYDQIFKPLEELIE